MVIFVGSFCLCSRHEGVGPLGALGLGSSTSGASTITTWSGEMTIARGQAAAGARQPRRLEDDEEDEEASTDGVRLPRGATPTRAMTRAKEAKEEGIASRSLDMRLDTELD